MVVLLCLLVAASFSQANAHIHSHKVQLVHRADVSLQTWTLALLSSLLVAAAGVFPLLLNRCLRLDGQQRSFLLRVLLNFAVGGLLGDVFLHLLPEAWGPASGAPGDWKIGCWVLLGLISFLLVEKVAGCTEPETAEPAVREEELSKGAGISTEGKKEGSVVYRNGHTRSGSSQRTLVVGQEVRGGGRREEGSRGVMMRGYLNLAANCTDNFTHGLAIAASYVISPTVGALTTAAILCHEVPHEVGDFAILLSSGFDSWSAAKAQALTATGGLVGVVAGLTAEQLSSASSWLLPFTAGGFLYIALVSIIPQLLGEERGAVASLVEVSVLVLGILLMAFVSMVETESCRHMPSLAS